MEQKKKLPKDQVTFIRKGGKVIPIKKKDGAGPAKKPSSSKGSKEPRDRDLEKLSKKMHKQAHSSGKKWKKKGAAFSIAGGLGLAAGFITKKKGLIGLGLGAIAYGAYERNRGNKREALAEKYKKAN